jgi:hypothetical protein
VTPTQFIAVQTLWGALIWMVLFMGVLPKLPPSEYLPKDMHCNVCALGFITTLSLLEAAAAYARVFFGV